MIFRRDETADMSSNNRTSGMPSSARTSSGTMAAETLKIYSAILRRHIARRVLRSLFNELQAL